MSAGESDFSKALAVLIHDLRAPLSVASGYLRLIREDRLGSPEDRDHALAAALEAVKRMSRLCDDASAYGSGEEPGDTPPTLISVEDLAARVYAALQSDGTSVEPQPVHGSGWVSLSQADRIAAAVAHLLRTCLRQVAPSDAVGIDVFADEQSVRFLAGPAAQRQLLTHNEKLPFDPWRGGHGLRVPTACRDLQRIAGTIWTTATTRSAIGIQLPLEARAS